MKNKLENTGITLISLVVTIIVLLILAGVTLSLIGGSEGILGRATHAVDENEKAMAKEQVELAVSDYQTEFYEAKYVDRTNDGTKKEYILEKLKGETYTEKYRVVTSEEGKVKVYEKNGVSKNPIVTGNVQEDGSIKWDDEIAVGSPEEGETEEKNEAIMINVAEPNISSDYVKATVHVQIEYEGTITEITINGEKVEATKGENGIYTIEKEFTENGEYKIIAKDEDGKVQIEIAKITELTEDMDIWNKADMERFRDKVNSGRTFEGRTARVMADIDLEGSETNQWVPIAINFKGTFEGNHHTISNIYINSSSDYQGLFRQNYGVIQNIVVGGTIKGRNCIGGITGYNYNTILNCRNNAYVQGAQYSGGIAGYNVNLIQKCYNTNEIYATDAGTGGIAGGNRDGIIKECYNTAYIHSGYQTAGGICGYTVSGKIYNCYNKGKVYAVSYNVGGINGAAGNSTSATVYTYNCYNLGTVSGNTHKGQITGWPNANAGSSQDVNCYTTNATAAGLNAGVYSDNIWVDDTTNINGGYPILKWQLEK